jgi:plasmid replication initiation protein
MKNCNFVVVIRTIVIPDKQNISINLPKQFVGKKVEVIAFSVDEPEQENNSDKVFTHLASEKFLAKDWLSTEEDTAWQNL